MLGLKVSFMVTVKEQLEVFPEPSVTKNVLVVIPTGKIEPETNPNVCWVIAPEQLSVPTGVLNVTIALQLSASLSCVIFPGQEMLGNWVSFILTIKEQVEVFPEPSDTKNVLVVDPKGKIEPEANPNVCWVTAPEQLSVPTGVLYVTTALQLSASLSCVIFPGHEMLGLKVSFMVTVKEQLEVFPEPSVTKNVLVVVPPGNIDPEANPNVC